MLVVKEVAPWCSRDAACSLRISLDCVPGVLFGFCYVPPADSPYFDSVLFSGVQEKVKAVDERTRFMILGDLNARFGEMVRRLPHRTGKIDANLAYQTPWLILLIMQA